MDLGVASKAATDEKGEEVVEVELKNGIDTIDTHYDEALESLLMKPEAVREVKKQIKRLIFKKKLIHI